MALKEKEEFTNWRRELSYAADGNQSRPGVLSSYIAAGISLGEPALEALFYLAGSDQYEVRLSVCEALGMIAAGELVSDTRHLLNLVLENFLNDKHDAVRFAAAELLQGFVRSEKKAIWDLFPAMTSTDRDLRALSLKTLHGLPCSVLSKLSQDPSDLKMDCLRQTYIPFPSTILMKPSCVVTLGRAGESACLNRLLCRLANELDPFKTDVVVLVNDDEESQALAQKFGATVVACRSATKSAVGMGPLFSAARTVNSGKYVCIDPRAIVTGSIARLIEALDALDEQGMFVCYSNNGGAVRSQYEEPLMKNTVNLAGGIKLTSNYYPMTAAFFGGHRASLLALDSAIRIIAPLAQPPVQQWENELFSLAAGNNPRHVPLNPTFTPVFNTEAVRV